MARVVAQQGEDGVSPTEGAMDRALARLEPADRDLVALTLEGRRTYAELAPQVGLSVSALRSRLHRVRQRLGELAMEELHADES